MDYEHNVTTPPPPQQQVNRNRLLLFFVFFVTIAFIGLLADGRLLKQFSAQGPGRAELAPAPVSTNQEQVPDTQVPSSSIPATLVPIEPADSLAVIAMPDGLFTHLFAFHPTGRQGRFIRLTNSPWDDIHPVISPDGTRIAYSSRQNGYWDLFVLDLTTGEQMRITDTAEFDGNPSWSPDGKWVAYESYVEDNLEIFIRTIEDPKEPPIRLTIDSAADYSPAWSPAGREIAFVSDRGGDADIWLAGLDKVDDRFVNLTAEAGGVESHPAWSPTGDRLAWSTDLRGNPEIMIWHADRPYDSPRLIGSGSWPSWHPQGSSILTEVRGPTDTNLAAYHVENGSLDIPLSPVNGVLHGLSWGNGEFLDRAARLWDLDGSYEAPALIQPQLTLSPVSPAGRSGIVPIEDVTAPYAYLHDEVDESYRALRTAVGDIAGWDVLANLEQAYLPLTEPTAPSIPEEWLYTGRAFNLNPLPIQAGWMLAVKESHGGHTYWRLFVKTRYQDGSQGRPLTSLPWDLDARYQGDPVSFEAGGAPGQIPSGYWQDFTELAARFDWQRLPALANWRTYYPAARFTQFHSPGNLDWAAAMNQLYPPEALNPPTAVPTLTLTPTLTPSPRYYQSPTPEPTATLTAIPTRRPTWTPLANTPTP